MIPPSFLKDASNFKGHAEKILFPCSEEKASLAIRQANRTLQPVTIAGAGSGLTGARVPAGGTVLSTDKLDEILKVRWDKRRGRGSVFVQPGVTLRRLSAFLEGKGLFYPPDPGETAAFLGGTAATNASGPRSFKYGPTRKWVLGLRLVLPTGEAAHFRRGQIRARAGFLRIPLADRKVVRVPVPTYRVPHVKNSAGYFADPRMDLVDLFVGSEGTLGLFTELELAVLRRPEAVVSGILFFSSEKACYRFMVGARRSGRQGAGRRLDPRVLEFFDRRSLALLSKRHPAIPKGAGGALLFEQECRRAEQAAIQQLWKKSCGRQGPITAEWISAAREDLAIFRGIRYDLPCLVNEEMSRVGFRKIGTDCAVPQRHGGRMLDFSLRTLGRCRIDHLLFGHIGDDHLHANLLPKTQAEWERAKEVYGILAREAIRLHGTISAEHGIGKVRIPYLRWMVGDKGLLEMARIKKLLDPRGILCPGNIIPEGFSAPRPGR